MTDPLFVQTREELLARLRLSGVASTSDAQCMIDQGIEFARLEIYQRAGDQTVTDVLGFTSTPTPTTEDERRRRAAEHWETELVRCWLLKTMPMFSADAAGDHRLAYNQEGIWRHLTQSDRLELLAQCRELLRDLEEKVTGEVAADEICVQLSAIGSEECNAQFYCQPPLNPAVNPYKSKACPPGPTSCPPAW